MKSAQAAPPFMDRGRVEDELRGRGCDILFGAVPPRTCQGTLERNRELCASNVCGSYGTNWGCPPGSGTAEECIGNLRSYGSAAIVIKRFPETDPGDPDLMASIGKDFQDACRAAKHMMEECGHRCLVLSDGGCMYCDVCRYPDPCPHPGEITPAVSGYGIDVESYLRELGVGFRFEEDAVTLYGIVLYDGVS